MIERIIKLRKELKLSQAKFAKQLGISAGTIGDIERGSRGVSKAVQNLIIKTFNLNSQWFKEGIGEMFNKVEKKSNEPQWYDDYMELTPTQQLAIQEIILGLKKSGANSLTETVYETSPLLENNPKPAYVKPPKDLTKEEVAKRLMSLPEGGDDLM